MYVCVRTQAATEKSRELGRAKVEGGGGGSGKKRDRDEI